MLLYRVEPLPGEIFRCDRPSDETVPGIALDRKPPLAGATRSGGGLEAGLRERVRPRWGRMDFAIYPLIEPSGGPFIVLFHRVGAVARNRDEGVPADRMVVSVPSIAGAVPRPIERISHSRIVKTPTIESWRPFHPRILRHCPPPQIGYFVIVREGNSREVEAR